MDHSLLKLDKDEYVVYEKEESYVLYKEEELELLITNLNLILVNETTPMFKKSTYEIIKFPISDIKVIDNIPQITLEHDKDNSYWNIVILFNKGIKKIGIYIGSVFKKFEAKKEAEQLVEKISQLRMIGTIILKQNKTENKDHNETFVESKVNSFKKSLIGEKIKGGINSIKKAVKPQETPVNKEKTVQDVFDTLNEEQKLAVQALVGAALEENNFTDSKDMEDYVYHSNLNDDSDGKTIKEIFDTLSEDQKLMVYALVGAAHEEAEDENPNNYTIRFNTNSFGNANITINGIFIKQLSSNQYYDFSAEVNVRYDIELTSGIAQLFNKKISIQEKNPLKNIWVGFGAYGNLVVDHYDMTSDKDIDSWVKKELKFKKAA